MNYKWQLRNAHDAEGRSDDGGGSGCGCILAVFFGLVLASLVITFLAH